MLKTKLTTKRRDEIELIIIFEGISMQTQRKFSYKEATGSLHLVVIAFRKHSTLAQWMHNL